MAKLKERYADVLLRLSIENDSIDKDLEKAAAIRDMLITTEVQEFLKNPAVPDSSKLEFFRGAFSGNIPEHLTGFIFHMVKKKHSSIIAPVLSQFIERASLHSGKVEAKVVSATELTKEQIDSICTLLEKKLNMRVSITATVDKDVIGGLYIMAGGFIFDCTVRTELNTLKESLRKDAADDS